MKKGFICLSLCICLVLSFVTSLSVSADSYTSKKIRDIISGKQDYLVFASLGNKDTSFFDAQVMAVVGTTSNLTDEEKDALKKRFEKSINLSGINTYRYYGENDDKPRTGDNVLVSISYNGSDNYSVKNGVFRVDSVSMEQFKFEVPETIDGKSEAMELSALYTYVYTNGSINDIKITDDGVYYKKTDDKDYTKQPQNIGISFLDEFGDPSGLADGKFPQLEQDETKKTEKSKWPLVSLILIFGMFLGMLVLKLVHKLDKRYDI